MKIESVDFFYLDMPEVLDIGDGSQNVLQVRQATAKGGGEWEASPMSSIASFVAPIWVLVMFFRTTVQYLNNFQTGTKDKPWSVFEVDIYRKGSKK